MNEPSTPPGPTDSEPKAKAGGASRFAMPFRVALMVVFVLWAHFGSGVPAFRSDVQAEPGWEEFRVAYDVDHFGADGQFSRAVRNGYNLVHHTETYAPRFTRAAAGTAPTSCSGCHSVEDIAYSFVNSDRVDPKLGRRMSFEERVRWCYANSLNGFVPTIYDPAVRDIRLLARAVARHLGLGEGALRTRG
ncbi:MAG: hypothetical protein K2W80_06805 [Burkholderiales bacterium]|nr:hypothetical protein [Burkholderiales bacterium]